MNEKYFERLRQLPPRASIAYLLNRILLWKLNRIAEFMGVELGTVKRYIFNIREQLTYFARDNNLPDEIL